MGTSEQECDKKEESIKRRINELELEHGNVTTYEWKYREKPISVENPEIIFEDEDEDEDKENPDDAEIDFGDDQEIDFGDDVGEIDYGDLEIGDGETADVID